MLRYLIIISTTMLLLSSCYHAHVCPTYTHLEETENNTNE